MNYSIYINIGMRASEILLELRDPFNQHKYYGAWVDSKTKKVWPVKSHGHQTAIPHILHTPITSPQYEDGYEAGLIRLVFDGSTFIIDGRSEDIHRIAPMLIAGAVQPNVGEVLVEMHIGDKVINKTFELPTDRITMMKFLKGEKE